MSTDRPTLTDYLESPDPAPGQDSTTTAAWAPAEPHCRQCAAADVADPRIDPEIARVIGDNDGRVPRCRRCTDGISRAVRAATNTAGRGDGLRVAPEGRR